MSVDAAQSRFVLDLPNTEAALALAGEAETTLHRLEALFQAELLGGVHGDLLDLVYVVGGLRVEHLLQRQRLRRP